MTNTSLRGRFRMNEKQRPQVSKLIRETVESGKIKLKDPDGSSDKFSVYVPYWA
ncbi:hypothetical protein [Flavisolibacter ginsenosidimutans]|nr:hypothetical protein [Flavisolibacter ginsenosidimutans]